MEITKMKIDGFRNVFNTIIEFSDITALIALNNYGKSNILDGIKFAENFIKLPSKIKSKMMKHIGSVPINNKTQDNNFTFAIEFKSSLDDTEILVSYEFSFEWIKNMNKGSRIINESLKIKENGNSKFSKLIDRTSEKLCYKSSRTGRADTKIDVSINDLIVNKLNDVEVYYSKIINELNDLRFDFNSFLDVAKVFEVISFNTQDEEDILQLDKDNGYNISNIVYYLREKHFDKYNLLINSFKSLVPTIEEIEPVCTDFSTNIQGEIEKKSLPFKIPEKIYDIKVKEKYNNQLTSMKMMSTGSKEFSFF